MAWVVVQQAGGPPHRYFEQAVAFRYGTETHFTTDPARAATWHTRGQAERVRLQLDLDDCVTTEI